MIINVSLQWCDLNPLWTFLRWTDVGGRTCQLRLTRWPRTWISNRRCHEGSSMTHPFWCWRWQELHNFGSGSVSAATRKTSGIIVRKFSSSLLSKLRGVESREKVLLARTLQISFLLCQGFYCICLTWFELWRFITFFKLCTINYPLNKQIIMNLKLLS